MTERRTSPNPRKQSLNWGERTYIVGVVNVTPDSFSDGGDFYEAEAAIAHARQLVEDGADIIDVGGESTRPNAPPVSEAEELRRILPVIGELTGSLPVPVSVDTMKARVAREALEAGAQFVNDVSGTVADPEIVEVAAEYDAGLTIVHNKPLAADSDLLGQIVSFWAVKLKRALAAGVNQENIVLDPGLGFRKGTKTNLELLRRLGELRRAVPHPIMLGHSRKSVVAHLFGASLGQRDTGTAALSAIAVEHGLDLLRVHDVQLTAAVVKGLDRLYRGQRGVETAGIETDVIRIGGIRCFAHHGVLDDERKRGQEFVIDVVLGTSLERAGRTDALDETIDYARLYSLIHSTVAGSRHMLIEKVADEVAAVILREHPAVLQYVEVTVHKPEALVAGQVDDIAVTIRRGPA